MRYSHNDVGRLGELYRSERRRLRISLSGFKTVCYYHEPRSWLQEEARSLLIRIMVLGFVEGGLGTGLVPHYL